MTVATRHARLRPIQSPIVRLLSPSLRLRFAIALLVSFFPFGILYPLHYPVGEILTLMIWVWVFPSATGMLSLAIVPLIALGSLGYFAFNLFCFLATLSVGIKAYKDEGVRVATLKALYRFGRFCILLEILICLLQMLTSPAIWTSIFPSMSLGSGGRGAGLRAEPSLLAGPLALYLLLLAIRIYNPNAELGGKPRRKARLREGILVILALLILTRSLSVLLIAIAFLPVLIGWQPRRRLALTMLGTITAIPIGILAFGSRIHEALARAGGSFVGFATVALGSWRNIPDLIILLNYSDFLFPGSPSAMRDKLNGYAVQLGPSFAWLDSTYSTFAAGALTLGLVVTAVVLVAGLAFGVAMLRKSKSVGLSWLLLYLCNWFLTPKFEPAGWVALGLLPVVFRFRETAPYRVLREDGTSRLGRTMRWAFKCPRSIV